MPGSVQGLRPPGAHPWCSRAPQGVANLPRTPWWDGSGTSPTTSPRGYTKIGEKIHHTTTTCRNVLAPTPPHRNIQRDTTTGPYEDEDPTIREGAGVDGPKRTCRNNGCVFLVSPLVRWKHQEAWKTLSSKEPCFKDTQVVYERLPTTTESRHRCSPTLTSRAIKEKNYLD